MKLYTTDLGHLSGAYTCDYELIRLYFPGTEWRGAVLTKRVKDFDGFACFEISGELNSRNDYHKEGIFLRKYEALCKVAPGFYLTYTPYLSNSSLLGVHFSNKTFSLKKELPEELKAHARLFLSEDINNNELAIQTIKSVFATFRY